MMDEAPMDVTEAEMLVMSLEETPSDAEVAGTLVAVEEADGISVEEADRISMVETEDEMSEALAVVLVEVEAGGESLSDSVVVAESGGELVVVSDVVVVVKVGETVSDSVVAESGGEVVLVSDIVVVVGVESGGESLSNSVVVAESGGELVVVSDVVVVVKVGETVSDSVVAESGGEVEVITDVVVGDATLDGVVSGSSVLVIEVGVEVVVGGRPLEVASGIVEVKSVDEALSGVFDIGNDEEANVVVRDDAVSDVDSENGVEDAPAKTLEADTEDPVD
ncbi:hypothetical protein DFH08DRAFT_808288 [Mycena albidolilacea]|uniref:Uncharacterized protein n=1 Tax=Mycena albidolilacea TaxID=1033008 RepID=A0AAD7A424_9AGAR|nr:hypothetical protein DFH08DRAFT_808288 [Mycena albidolilacea]